MRIGSLGGTVFFLGGTLYPCANYEGKEQKMVQYDKTNFSLSQELYLIWLWFLVHVCKMPQSLL